MDSDELGHIETLIQMIWKCNGEIKSAGLRHLHLEIRISDGLGCVEIPTDSNGYGNVEKRFMIIGTE